MNEKEPSQLNKHRAGYVSILGRPNVGKSTFLNHVLGVKLSITSTKPQTTRHRILGIHSSDDYQIMFLDTPGMIRPKYLLQDFMMSAVQAAIEDADVILFMVQASERLWPDDELYLDRMKARDKPIIVLINKIDLVKKSRLLPMMEQIVRDYGLDVLIPISALHEDGLERVMPEIVSRLPESPPFYPHDQLTEHPERFIVAEMIREQIFEHYGEEIPYSTTVSIEEYQEHEGKKDVISAIIYVERSSQKGILIGKKGSALKTIGQAARQEIEAFLQRPVFLELWVRVKEKWRADAQAIREFGYGAKLPRR